MKVSKKLLVCLLALGLMTGCSGKKTTTETPAESEIVTEITAPVEITFWHAMSGAQEESLKKLTEKFMSENKNITVNLQNQSSYQDLQQKLTATVASPKNLPTLTQAYPDWMLNPIKDGLVLGLDNFIKHEKIGFDNYDDILPSFREAAQIDGVTYGVPFNKSTEVLWYNKTLFDELGLKAPTTMEELATVAKEIKTKKNIVGGGFDSLSNYYTTYLKNEGVTFDPKFDPASDASVKAVDYYLNGIKDGYFRIAGTDKFLSGPFANETIGMFVGSNAGESFVTTGVNGKFDIGVAPYPAENKMQQGTDLYVFSSATPEQQTAAFEYLKFLTTKENQITWAKETGYIPVRTSALESDEYKNSGSLVAPILTDATKGLYTNPVSPGADSAYRESATMLEGILAQPTADVKAKLDEFKSTLTTLWE
ncbi:MAG: ABC transporter substrate-binding protein [Peptostreptococcaceae bacterium]